MTKIILALATAAAALVAAAPAHAAPTVTATTTTTFNFRGKCSDCEGYGTGQLVLKDYVLGEGITKANVVSFSYDGSNLYQAFSITAPVVAEGVLFSNTAAGGDLTLRDATNFLMVDRNGTWSLGKTGNLDSDRGTDATFALATPAAAVPEPATWALMLAGFGLTGAAMRRRRHAGAVRVVA